MKQRVSNSLALPLAVMQILSEHSSEQHPLTLQKIQEYLEEEGFVADRRTLYKVFGILNDYDYPVISVRNKTFGYYMEHLLTPAEAFFLMQEIQNSISISEKRTRQFTKKVSSLLSETERKQLPEMSLNAAKTDNDDVLKNISALMPAIREKNMVSFRYFDKTADKKKRYRREESYQLVPYAITMDRGRYYCVFYSERHQNFSSYRIDKMDHLKISETKYPTHPFSLTDYLRRSVNMYHGEGQTITAIFDQKISSQVYDEFGDRIIFQGQDDTTFTASIRTAITPTLISWLLLFPDQITITSPVSLQDQLVKIADQIYEKYRNGESSHAKHTD